MAIFSLLILCMICKSVNILSQSPAKTQQYLDMIDEEGDYDTNNTWRDSRASKDFANERFTFAAKGSHGHNKDLELV